MTHIQQRGDHSAVWQAVNPVLMEREAGHETDTGKWKLGDGVTAWNDLGYKAGVDSVAGRTGEVSLTVGDVAGAAPLADPTFTGAPKAPTPNVADNGTRLATTAFVKTAVDALDTDLTTLIANAIAAAKLAMYPIGAIYTSTTPANPSTFIGGTWTRYANGRVLVGLDESSPDIFNDIGEEGGSKRITLSAAESGMPSHTHGVNDPSHVHNQSIDASYNPGAGGTAGKYAQNNTGANSVAGGLGTGPATTGISIINAPAQAASASHDNVQPYVTVYIWRRTA